MPYPPKRYIPHPELGMLTNKEAAELRGVSEATVSRWIRILNWAPEDIFINNREPPIKYVFGQRTIKVIGPDGEKRTLAKHAEKLGGSYCGMVRRYRQYKAGEITEEQLFRKFRKSEPRFKEKNRKVDWEGKNSIEAGRNILEEERQQRLHMVAKQAGISI